METFFPGWKYLRRLHCCSSFNIWSALSMNKNTSGWLATFISHLGYDYSTGCRREGGKDQNLKYLEIDNRRGFEPHHCSRLVTAPSGGAGHAHPQPAWQTEIVSLAQISNEKIIPPSPPPPPTTSQYSYLCSSSKYHVFIKLFNGVLLNCL